MAASKRLTAEVKDRIRRMKWWHEARLGMFIHWGLYAQVGRHEWAMETEAIPLKEYEALADTWKPKPNAAREWPARIYKYTEPGARMWRRGSVD